MTDQNDMGRQIHDECGIFGVVGIENAAELTYHGLHALQHRGQSGCGIVSVDNDGVLKRIKGTGLVTEVFNAENLMSMEGSLALGHVRYPTAGGKGIENVQPLLFRHNSGDFAIAQNGNVINYNLLRKSLEDRGNLLHTTSDSEVLALLVKKPSKNPDRPRIFQIEEALSQIEGAFTFALMTKNRLYVARDKYGLKPISIGKLGGGYVVSSETCAFNVVGAEFVRDVGPGEIVTINSHGIRSKMYTEDTRHAMCAMEYIYFSRPDSDIECTNVHTFRKGTGKLLWQEAPADADIVIGVPDSSLSAAMGYSEAGGLPYEMGLVKNRYIGRTFIQPSQRMREKGVKMKLSAVKSIVGGKRVVLIDDSIVRGTTSKRIVKMLREAGATKVDVRIASPMIKSPCFYGVDITTYDELMCADKTLEEVTMEIGADSLAFLSTRAMFEVGKRSDFCLGCFDGVYPTPLFGELKRAQRESRIFNKQKKQKII